MQGTCGSADLQVEFADKGLPSKRVWRIPNGVDTDFFQSANPDRRRQLAAQLELPTERPIALFVGVFDERKRIAWLVEQWIETEGFGTGRHLVAVGPTSRESYGKALKAELRQRAEQRPDLVTIRAFTPAIRDYYQASQILLFPSSKEGLPNTVLEAMACGLPCVVARASGARELVKDGVNGATFTVDDGNDLARALHSIAGAETELGAKSRNIVLEEFGIEAIADRYEALYRELLQAQRKQPSTRLASNLGDTAGDVLEIRRPPALTRWRGFCHVPDLIRSATTSAQRGRGRRLTSPAWKLCSRPSTSSSRAPVASIPACTPAMRRSPATNCTGSPR